MDYEKSTPTYEEFEPGWRRQHRAMLPRKKRVIPVQEYFWILFWVVVASGAAVFSAAHTIPAAELTILRDVPDRANLAKTVFVIIELVIFGAAAKRHEIGWLKWLLAGAVAVALAGNIGSSVRAVNINGGDGLNQFGGVLMAIIAPLTALAAGEIVHMQFDSMKARKDAADAEFQLKLETAEAKCRGDYNRLVKLHEKQKQAVSSREDFMKIRELHESSQADMKSDEPKKARVKLHEVAKQIHENGDADLSVDEMMRKYEISQGSTSKIRDILKQQGGKTFTNGHGGGTTPLQ